MNRERKESMKNLYPYISKRKSTRKYEMEPIEEGQLREIKAFAEGLKPLNANIEVKYELTEDVKNLLPVKAPHYFLIYSENKEDYLVNVGFMFQQMDLFLSSKGLGSCWLGMAKPTKSMNTKLEFVIALAFGKALEAPYRELSEFKRKPLSEISMGKDNRLESARLAPSATNSQNWFFVAQNERIHLYRKKLNAVRTLLYNKMNQVDIGITLCHLYIASLEQEKPFSFSQEKKPKGLKGYHYMGTVG
jgi:nitroreductase